MLVTPERVAEVLGDRFVDPPHLDAANLADSLVKSYIGASITAASATHDLAGTWDTRLCVGERPVREVHAVTIDGVPCTDFVLRAGRGELHRRAGWGGPYATVSVTYSYGFHAVPQELRQVALSLAVRLAANPAAWRSSNRNTTQSDDGSSTSSGRSWVAAFPGPGFTVGELVVLDRYRRKSWP